jgi:Ca-activated chloride channel family protein
VSFHHPGVAILAAAALPAVFVALRVAARLQRHAAFSYSHLAFLTGALKAPAWPAITLDAANATAYALLLLATAQPRYTAHLQSVGTIVVCIDTSGSMRSQDVAPSRAQAALRAMRSFAAAVPLGTRVGIVAFAGTARIIAAPSADRKAVLNAVASVPPPNGQTAIGDALLAASTLLPARGPRAVLLITDGTNNRGVDPGPVARSLTRDHARLEVIAVGTSPRAGGELRSAVTQAGGSFVPLRRAVEFRAAAVRAVSEMTVVSRPLDCAEPCTLAGLVLLTAAWAASQRGAFRL